VEFIIKTSDGRREKEKGKRYYYGSTTLYRNMSTGSASVHAFGRTRKYYEYRYSTFTILVVSRVDRNHRLSMGDDQQSMAKALLFVVWLVASVCPSSESFATIVLISRQALPVG
jgi:hypothetical protein